MYDQTMKLCVTEHFFTNVFLKVSNSMYKKMNFQSRGKRSKKLLKVIFPHRTLNKKSKFFDEFPEVLLANFIFYLKRTIIRVCGQIFRNF